MGILKTGTELACHPGCPPFPLTSGSQIPRVLHPRLVHCGKEADVSLLQREGRPQEDVQQPVSFGFLLGVGREESTAIVSLHLGPPGPSLLTPAWYMLTILCGLRSRKVGDGTWGRTSSSASHHSSARLVQK